MWPGSAEVVCSVLAWCGYLKSGFGTLAKLVPSLESLLRERHHFEEGKTFPQGSSGGGVNGFIFQLGTFLFSPVYPGDV